MSVRSLAHLMRRSGVFYFRRAVPEPFRDIVGRREVCLSLRTRDATTARLLCRLCSNLFEQLMEVVEGMPELGKDKVDAMIRGYFEGLLSKAKETVFLTPQDPALDPEFEATLAEEERQRLQAELAKCKFDKTTLIEAQELAGTGESTPHNVPADEFRALCNGVLRARIEQRRIYAAMLRGAYDAARKIIDRIESNLTGAVGRRYPSGNAAGLRQRPNLGFRPADGSGAKASGRSDAAGEPAAAGLGCGR